jgi:serine/threonine-protein kinase ATR
MILNQAEGMLKLCPNSQPKLLGFAVEAAWISGKWDVLDNYLERSNEHTESLYELRIGRALSALRGQDAEAFAKVIASAREDVVNGLTESSVGSLGQCHDSMVKLHSLSELEEISFAIRQEDFDREVLASNLQRRLDLMGTYSKDKQYLLALRRAAFQLSG